MSSLFNIQTERENTGGSPHIPTGKNSIIQILQVSAGHTRLYPLNSLIVQASRTSQATAHIKWITANLL